MTITRYPAAKLLTWPTELTPSNSACAVHRCKSSILLGVPRVMRGVRSEGSRNVENAVGVHKFRCPVQSTVLMEEDTNAVAGNTLSIAMASTFHGDDDRVFVRNDFFHRAGDISPLDRLWFYYLSCSLSLRCRDIRSRQKVYLKVCLPEASMLALRVSAVSCISKGVHVSFVEVRKSLRWCYFLEL